MMVVCSVYDFLLHVWQTVEFELRKLEAQQALQQVALLKTFMPNSFLVSGGIATQVPTPLPSFSLTSSNTGDYDAIQVLMLLPRIIFKADLVTDQLKQQACVPHWLLGF